MSIFSKHLKKRKSSKYFDSINVILNTEKQLSEEEKNAIITVVKEGIISGFDLDDIAIQVTMITEIYDTIVLNRSKNGVEVII